MFTFSRPRTTLDFTVKRDWKAENKTGEFLHWKTSGGKKNTFYCKPHKCYCKSDNPCRLSSPLQISISFSFSHLCKWKQKNPNITQQMSSATQSTVWLKTNKHTAGILHLWYLVGVPKKLAKTTNWLMRFGAEPAAANIQAVFAYFAFFSLSFTHAYALRWHQWQMLILSVLLLQRAEWNNLSFSKK